MPQLGLGTAQFGSDYGISNRAGRTTPREAARILRRAAKSGIRVIDTAAGYGRAEEVLGELHCQMHAFRVVTKVPSLRASPDPKAAVCCLEKAFERSLARLRQSRVYGLLMHDADDLSGPHGPALRDALVGLQAKGLVDKVGVSVYDVEQFEAVLEAFVPDLVQLPINVLDQRFLQSGALHRLQEQGIEVHGRSVFLQGLLLMPLQELLPAFAPIRPLLERYRRVLSEHGLTLLEGALGFVKKLEAIDVVLVGFNNVAQLEECLCAFETTDALDYSSFACNERRFIVPSEWNVPA